MRASTVITHTDQATYEIDYLYDDTPDFNVVGVDAVLEYLQIQDERQLEMDLTTD